MLKLERLVIKKLFGTFDYTIDLKPDDLTVLISPNGYGKTTILRILYELAQRNFLYFVGLNFQKIEICLTNEQSIVIEKQDNTQLCVTIDSKPYSVNFKKILKWLYNEDPFFQESGNIQNIVSKSSNTLGYEYIIKYVNRQFDGIPEFQFPNIYLIREQRLLRKIENKRNNNRMRKIYGRYWEQLQSKPKLIFEETIDKYANVLKEIIVKADSEYAEKSRELDSSYPRRLIESKTEIPENNFKTRFDKIKETQRLLQKYGISVTYEENSLDFDPVNAKALYVYINDVEEKLRVFEPLLKTLNLFSEILHSKEFPHKNITISKEYGLKFVTDNGDSLELSGLSSGEQHEIVLLFDLLFQADQNTLVLIDEPEISLHIVWQKAFLADMLKIIELQKISVMVATHSPQIVNDYWENVIDFGGYVT
ncbi:MAG: AAA family ATPase [Planctomycetaceae bacterium]|jgi:energy-coupling factor transporter ATP-binding protein EcfA2|nr:AAA family ATPase [Planctomycetaceae bacterium]